MSSDFNVNFRYTKKTKFLDHLWHSDRQFVWMFTVGCPDCFWNTTMLRPTDQTVLLRKVSLLQKMSAVWKACREWYDIPEYCENDLLPCYSGPFFSFHWPKAGRRLHHGQMSVVCVLVHGCVNFFFKQHLPNPKSCFNKT